MAAAGVEAAGVLVEPEPEDFESDGVEPEEPPAAFATAAVAAAGTGAAAAPLLVTFSALKLIRAPRAELCSW